MHCAKVAEELAPLEKARVDEVTVQADPELLSSPSLWGCVPCPVVGGIPKAVQTQNASSAETCAAMHLERPNHS